MVTSYNCVAIFISACAWFESMAYVVPKGTTTFPLIINFTIWERQIFNINAWETTGNDSKLQTKQDYKRYNLKKLLTDKK